MAKRLPTIRVNLVEEEGWKPWSYEERFGELVADAVWNDWASLKADDVMDYLAEIVKPARGRMARKRWGVLTQEDLGRAAEAAKKGDPTLESTRQAFVDAMQYMYEEAGTPTDRDIERAVEFAQDNRYGNHLGFLWEGFLDATGMDADEVAAQVVGKPFSKIYHRKPGWYDRYIVLSWNEVPAARQLLSWLSEHSENGPPSAKEVDEALRTDLGGIAGDFVYDVLLALQKIHENVDWANRAKWRKHWEIVREERKGEILRELLDFTAKTLIEEGA